MIAYNNARGLKLRLYLRSRFELKYNVMYEIYSKHTFKFSVTHSFFYNIGVAVLYHLYLMASQV